MNHADTAAVSIEGLVVDFVGAHRTTRALDGVDLRLDAGRSLAIVGESGAGKSTVASILGRLEPASARRVAGTVAVAGKNVFELDKSGMRELRRTTLGFVPQDPIASLDPTMRIGKQLELVFRHLGMRPSRAASIELLDEMLITNPARTLRLFPHEVSGGMAQRIAIALALVASPALLIADEPTAALDSNVREEVMRLLFERARVAGTSILWLSHDLSAVGRWCDDVAVMYRGRVVESGPIRTVFRSPSHRYTAALLAADPARARPGERLRTIDDFDDDFVDADDVDRRTAVPEEEIA